MIRRVLAQLLIGTVLAGSAPASRPEAPEVRPVWVPAPAVAPVSPMAPSGVPALPVVSTEVSTHPDENPSSAVHLAEGALAPEGEREPPLPAVTLAASLPLRRFSGDASREARPAVRESAGSLLLAKNAALPSPGIQRQILQPSQLQSEEVRPPGSPLELVRYFPNEYAAPGEKVAEKSLTHHLAQRSTSTVLRQAGSATEERDAAGRLVRIRYADGSTVTFGYDGAGRRIRMTDARGTTLYRYDESGRLEAVRPPGLSPIRYRYDEAGRLTTVLYPGGQVVSYEYDGEGHLTAIRDDRGLTRYDYDSVSGRLNGQSLPNGIFTSYGYDTAGRLIQAEHRDTAGRLVLGFSYVLDEAGRPVLDTRETADGPQTTAISYDTSGRVASVTGPLGRVATFEYDEQGRRVRRMVTEGADVAITDYEYDERGRLIRAGDEALEYDDQDRLVLRRSADRTIEYAYDFAGRLARYVDGRASVAYEYDFDGLRSARIENDRRAELFRDPLGRVLLEIEAGRQRLHVQGPLGRLGAIEPDGVSHTDLYDHPGWSLAALTDARGELETLFESDPWGLAPLTAPLVFGGPRDPVSGLVELEGRDFDPELGLFLTPELMDEPGEANGEATAPRVSASLAERLARSLGGHGPPASEPREASSPAAPREARTFQSNQLPPPDTTKGEAPRIPFPELSQVQAGAAYKRVQNRAATTASPVLRLHPSYLHFARTANGLLPASQTLEVTSTTGASLPFSLSEDIPWLTVDSQSGTAGAQAATITVVVDGAGLAPEGSPYSGDLVLTNLSDPADVRRVRVRLTVSSTAAAVTLRSLDSNGYLQRVIQPDGSQVNLYRDAASQLVRVLYSDGEDVRYTYNANGWRETMTDRRGTAVYQYDAQGRLTALFNPGLNPLRFAYTRSGKIDRLTYPDGRSVSYQYDADDRPIRVVDGPRVTQYEYDSASGLLTAQVLPNGIRTIYAYNADRVLTDITHRGADGNLILAFHYTLDADGHRTAVTRETPTASQTTTYVRDKLQRLTQVTYPDGRTVSYSYDPFGNRLTKATMPAGGSPVVVQYRYDNAGRLLEAGNEVFLYDANGNLIRRASPQRTVRYTYNVRGLLTRVEDGTQVVEFEYDGDGRRVGKIVDGVRKRFVNSTFGLSNVLMEADGSWTLEKTYTYGLQRLSVDASSESRFFLSDSKSTAALTDGNASVFESYDYDDFGLLRGAIGSNNFLYNGEQLDSETGLIYLRARYYDPSLGRFLSPDFISGRTLQPQGSNPYTFAANDPVDAVDPSGLDSYLVSRPLQALPGVAEHMFVATDADYPGDSKATIYSYARTADGKLGRVYDSTYTEDGKAWAKLESPETRDVTSSRINATDATVAYYASNLRENHTYSPVPFSLGFPVDFTIPILNIRVNFFFGVQAMNSNTAAQAVANGAAGQSVSIKHISPLGAPGDSLYQHINFDSPRSSYIAPLNLTILQPPAVSWPGRLGGVSLNKTANLLLEIDDIAGATYDEATGQIVLFGEDDAALPPMDLDDVAVAVESVFSGQDPGVSIDPPIQNNRMSVRFEGKTAGTEFGAILYEADRVLKILTLGKDNITGQSVSSSVPGYKNMLRRRLDAGCGSVPTSTRMWFQPKEIRLTRSQDGQTMVFDEVSMELLYESKVGNQVVSDPQAAAFASHMTQNYAAFAAEWPVLKEIERLGKIVGVIKWIKDNQIPIDLSFIENYPIEFFSTPTTTPATTVQGSRTIGPVTCTVTIQGGVTYRPPNEYLADDPVSPVTDAVRDEALSSRPSETQYLWSFAPSSLAASRLVTSGPMTAVAQSLTRSRKDGGARFSEIDLSFPMAGGSRMELARHYDSFGDRPAGPLGSRWSLLPVELRFPLAKQPFTFGPTQLALDLYPRIWLIDRAAQREDSFVLLGVDNDNLPLYQRSGSMEILRQLSDETFRLTLGNLGETTFAADGRPAAQSDPNGNRVDYLYDAGKRLIRLQGDGGRAISLTYDTVGRLLDATGPGGDLVTYGYDANGRLRTVTDEENQTRTYGYDAEGGLTSVLDARGNPVFGGSYDDYGRTPSRRLGHAADYAHEFDLSERRSTVSGPLGEHTESQFDSQYRLTERLDTLRNRLRIAYAGDFGPQSLTDAQGALTELAYDSRGNITAVVDPAGARTEFFYDWKDRLVAVRDPEGGATAFGYDDRGNLTTRYHTVQLVQDASGNLTSFNYDPNNISRFAFDADGNLEAMTDPLGHQGRFVHNADGRISQVLSPTQMATDLAYDAQSRLTQIRQGGNQLQLTYDDAHRVTAVTTTGAGNLRYVYNATGHITSARDSLNNETRFVYDADGNLTDVEDAENGVTEYDYDVLGHLTEVRYPNGITSSYDYDELGRPVVTLSGTGPASPRLGLGKPALDFGRVAVGTSSNLTIDLYNLGRVPLAISAVTVAAPFSTDFPGAISVPPGDFLTLTVTFSPSAAGPAASSLTVTSNDPDLSARVVALAGEGSRKVINLRATPTLGGIRLTWDPFSTGGQAFARFHVYRSTSPIPGSVAGLTPINTSLTDPATTTFVDTTATAGVPYHYAVTARFANGFEDPSVDPAGPVAFFDASTTFGGIGRSAVAADGARHETWPAAVYNSAADEYLLVYEWDAAGDGSNLDVYGQRLSAGGARLGVPFAISAGTQHEQRPQVGYSTVSNEYLVIFERATGATNFDIYGRRVSAAGAPVGTAFAIGATTVHDRRPQLAYNPTGNQYLVVYDRDTAGNGSDLDVAGRRVSGTGAVLGSEFFIGNILINGVSVHDRNPHVTWNSTTQEYLVAYEADRNDNGTDFDIVGQRVSATGTNTGNPKFLGSFLYSGQPGHELNPHLAYDSVNNQYMMAFEVDRNRDGQNPDVYVRKFRFDAAGEPVAVVTLAQAIANSALRETAPRVGYSPVSDENAVVWTVEASPGDGEIGARRIKINNSNFLIAGAFPVSEEAVDERRPALAFDGETNRYLAIWEHDGTAAGTGFDLRLRHLGYSTPLLEVVPTALNFGATLSNLPLTVSNVGPGTLSWTASASQTWLSTLPASGSVAASGSSNVSVRVDRSGLPPGSYADTVRISSSGGAVDVAVTMTVENSPPNPPSQPSPADGAVNQVGPAGLPDFVLTWQGSDPNGDPLTYSVYLSSNASLVTSLAESVRLAQGLTLPSLAVPNLGFLTSYFWRVVATDSRGGSTAGPVWSFSTASVGTPVLHPVTPDPTRETRPALSWQAVTGAATYHLQVANNASFSPSLIDTTGITATSFTPASALPQETIYWRVRSMDAAGQPGAFSTPDTFVIDTTAAGVPVVVPVTPDPTNNARPTLAWSAVTGAASYRVLVSKTSGFSAPFIDEIISTLTYQPASDLPEGAVYWRVASLDAAGNQSAYDGDQFTLDTTPPPAISSLTAQRQGAGVDLTWLPLGTIPDFARFRIYRAEAPFTNVTGITLLNGALTSAAAVSFHDGTASPGVAYWYAVTAVDTAGNENREVVTAQVLANEPPSAPVLVTPTVGAQVLPSGAMAVTLAWSAVDPENDPLRFEVYLSTDFAQVDGAPDITARVAEDLQIPVFEAVGLSYQRTYHWRVVALDLAADGSVRSATFGPVWSFILPAIPAPVLTALAPDPTREPRPTFTWQAVPGATGYRIELAGDPAFVGIVAAAETTESSWTPDSDLSEGTLYWHVRAIDAAGQPGEFSAADDFVLDRTAPAVPVLVQVTPDPTNNRRPSLAWGAVTGAVSYQLQVSTDPSFSAPLVDVAVAGTAYVPVSDLPEGTIYWRVASEDGLGNRSAFSGADEFVVDATAPAVPVLVPVTPDPTNNRRPSLAWGAVAGAASYRLQISTNPSFSAPLVDVAVAGTTYVPASDLPEGTIYWRVASEDGLGNRSAFSAADEFVVDATAPAVPVLVPVTPDPTNNRRPGLAWGAVTGAVSYQLQVSTNLGFSSPLLDVSVAGTAYVPALDLPEGTIYWRVASKDSLGNQSAFSTADEFVVDATAPAVPVLVPVTPDPTNNRRPGLAWGAVTGAVSYQLQVSTSPSFSASLVDVPVAGTAFVPASDLPEGTIYWRVASEDGLGNRSAFSAADEFVVDATAPAVPVLVPVTPDPTNNRRPSLAWGAVTGAASYQLQVSSSPGFSSPLLDVSVAGTAYVPASDLSEGTLYWRVASKDSLGNQSAFSTADEFVVDATAPAVPVLVPLTPDPTNNRRPGLVWGAVTGAVSYQLQVSTSPSFSASLVDVAVAGTAYVPVSDLPEGSIYWRVASEDSLGNRSAFSAADDFVVDATAPAVPVLVPVIPDPTNNRRPSLAWGAVTSAASYQFQISTDPSFSASLVDVAVAGTAYVPVSDLPQGSIYWRVASEDGLGNRSAFSTADDFVVDATAPAVPVLVPVTPDPTNNRRPGLSWGAVTGAVSYQLQVSTSPSFSASLLDVGVAGTTYAPASDLPEGQIYWRLASLDSTSNQSAFSTPSSFLVDWTPPPAVAGLIADWADPGTHLVWAPFSAPDVALLRVYRSDTPFSDLGGRTPVATLTDPLAASFADPAAAHGVIHHYAVTAVDQAGNEIQTVTSAATPPPGGDLYTVVPCRILDTRSPDGPFGGPALAAGQPRSLVLAGRCGIPGTARAIVVNIAAVSATAPGFIRVYPGGSPAPLTSAINFTAGLTRTNNGILALQADGTGTLVLEAGLPAEATVQVILDVAGYFE